MSYLGPEPAKFAPLPRAFFSGLVALLDALAPPLLDQTMTKASPREDGIEVVLAHATDLAFTISVQAERAVIVIGCGAFSEEHGDAARALALVAQLLSGAKLVRGYDGSMLRPDFGARASADA